MPKELADKNILIAGLPGVGKTTLIVRLLGKLKSFDPAGFYTAEIRKNNIRQGFELIGLDGSKAILSHVNFISTYKIGKYGVDIETFERFMAKIDFFNPSHRLIIIDEIGKMECLSKKFRDMIELLLAENKFLIATIASRGDRFIEKVKTHSKVELFDLTEANRNEMPERIIEIIEEHFS
jgi:nucleoside-triphosphatase